MVGLGVGDRERREDLAAVGPEHEGELLPTSHVQLLLPEASVSTPGSGLFLWPHKDLLQLQTQLPLGTPGTAP